jgi:lysophospholipase L1-like esterase
MAQWLTYCLIALCFFSYGVVIDHYKLPPFSILRFLAKLVRSEPDSRTRRGVEYLSRMTLFSALPGNAQIIMLGDSFTQLADWRELFPDLSILNRGISGDTTDGVLERLNEVISRHPKLVFLMIGVNDLQRRVPVRTVEKNIHSIISRLRACNIEPIVQAILFVSDDAIVNRRIATLNAAISGWCAEKGIAYLDMNPTLAPDGGLLTTYTCDGVHLNGAGYLCWRTIMAAYIARLTLL